MKFEAEIQWTGEGTVDDAIVRAAAHAALDNTGREEIQERVLAAVTGEIDKRMGDLVDRAFSEVVQPTDTYGKPVGPPQSMSDRMVDHMETFLDQKVDDKGKPIDACGYGTKHTRAEWIAKRIAGEVWANNLEGKINKVVEGLRQDLYEKAVTQYAQKLKAIFDQAVKEATP